MSYFLQENAYDETPCLVEDQQHHAEVADGVVIERRSVLWFSAAAVTSMLAAGSSLVAQDPRKPKPTNKAKEKRPGKLTFDEFFEQMLPNARRLIESKGEDEAAYLMTVAAAMSRLQDPNGPIRDAMRTFSAKHRKEGERFPIGAMSMSFKEGRGFSHHDHLNYNGIIMGLEGEVRIRNYDFQGEPPATDSTKTFLVRETRDDLILPGRFSSLGCKRENIHDLVAGKGGAKVLDVFTFFQRNAGSRYLELADKPRDPETRVYEATWRQRRQRKRR